MPKSKRGRKPTSPIQRKWIEAEKKLEKQALDFKKRLNKERTYYFQMGFLKAISAFEKAHKKLKNQKVVFKSPDADEPMKKRGRPKKV